MLDKDSSSWHMNTDFFKFLFEEIASGFNSINLMHTERCNPFIHVTFGWSSKKNLSLDEAGLLAEYYLECKLLFSFLNKEF